MMPSSFPDKLDHLKVLVVDDHPVNREFLRAGLTPVVARLDLADSGESAIERCRNEAYHVILMDLHMPQLDGLATANRIRDLEGPSSRARMVVMTADARPEERARLLENGFDAYLSKPLSIPQLTTALGQIMAPAAGEALKPEAWRDAGTETLLETERVQTAGHRDPGSAVDLGLMFGRELEQRLPVLDRWLIEGRYDMAADLLHQWTGASGFAGALRFSRACAALRRALIDEVGSSTGTAYTDFLRIALATSEALNRETAGPVSG